MKTTNHASKYPLALMQTPTFPPATLKHLAGQLGCPILQAKTPEAITLAEQILMVDASGILKLQKAGKKNTGAVFVDFTSGAADHRRRFGGGKGQAIAKAVGLKDTRHSLSILDCTAGLGRDAFVLATLGCQVTLLERSPAVAALLNDGLQRAITDSRISNIIQRMILHTVNAHDYLQQLSKRHAHTPQYDVIYLDPMFPDKKKNATVKKEMLYLQKLLSSDDDADRLLPLALEQARYRVVVKRPRIAPDLNNTPPAYRLVGKSNRFDIYTIKSLKSI